MEYWRTLILRSVREGTLQMWRNKFLSGTTVLLGALILFLLNFVFAVQYFTDYSLKNLESRADFSIPLRADYDVFEFDALKNDLNNNFSVDIKLLEAENYTDFSVPPRLHVKFSDLREVAPIFQLLKGIRYDEVVGQWDGLAERDFVVLVDKLLRVRNGVETASFWLSILFIGGGIMLAVNAFRIVLFSRRNEIFISRLVGADTWFIAGPFLWEGILLGFLSGLLAILTFTFVLREIDFLPGGDIFLHLWNNLFSYEVLIAGMVGVLGAWLAIKRYLTGELS